MHYFKGAQTPPPLGPHLSDHFQIFEYRFDQRVKGQGERELKHLSLLVMLTPTSFLMEVHTDCILCVGDN